MLLGKAPDNDVARIVGVDRATVVRERRRRKIPAFKSRRSRVEWTDEMIALLGTDTDGNVAATLGLSLGSVNRKRRMLGIPAFAPRPGEPPGLEWTPALVRRLGTVPDRQLAEELGVSTTTVQFRRQLLGIPPFAAPPERIEWTDDMIEALGTGPDEEIADRLGVSVSTVKYKREELGMPAWRRWPGLVERTPELREALERPNAEALARAGIGHGTATKARRELGIDMREVQARRWTPEIIARLGKEPDGAIARDIGLTAGGVRRKRLELGIPRSSGRRRWTHAERALLGTAPDEVIARRINRSIRAVAGERKARGVPEYVPRRRRSA